MIFREAKSAPNLEDLVTTLSIYHYTEEGDLTVIILCRLTRYIVIKHSLTKIYVSIIIRLRYLHLI
jgi:hypothetical protein